MGGKLSFEELAYIKALTSRVIFFFEAGQKKRVCKLTPKTRHELEYKIR